MIEAPPTLTIRENPPRPERSQVAALASYPTGFVVDALDGVGAFHHSIKALVGTGLSPDVCGPVLTCDCGPADNLALLAALSQVQSGDVIVVATAGWDGCAVVGDRVLGMARNAGAVGLLTDGMVRDLSGIRKVGLPVYCRGISPNSPVANGPGSVGEPVVLGGLNVRSGDVLISDEDGAVIVPYERLGSVLARLEQIQELEIELDAKVDNGLILPEAVEQLLASDQTRRLG